MDKMFKFKSKRSFGNSKKTEIAANLFLSWECISVIRDNNTSLDLVIEDQHALFCLMHCLKHIIFPCFGQNCLRNQKMLRFKMKLAYESM